MGILVPGFDDMGSIPTVFRTPWHKFSTHNAIAVARLTRFSPYSIQHGLRPYLLRRKHLSSLRDYNPSDQLHCRRAMGHVRPISTNHHSHQS